MRKQVSLDRALQSPKHYLGKFYLSTGLRSLKKKTCFLLKAVEQIFVEIGGTKTKWKCFVKGFIKGACSMLQL
jgi:hypothetical protein